MRNETARREIESLDYYLQNHTDDYSEESHTAMMMAIDALSNEDVLDKIMEEIEEIETYDGLYIDRAYVLQIIDRYRNEV